MLVLVLCVAALVSGPAGGRPAHIGCLGRDIRFSAADGVKLVAHRFGSGPVAVVLAHDDDGNLCTWVPFATQLAHRGYTAIAFDFRGYGESELRRGRARDRFAADVTAAVHLARRLGAAHVVVIGAGMGGWASLVAAAVTSPPVDAAVSVSTSAEYLTNALPFVSRLTMPLLFVASKGDAYIPVDARRMSEAAPARVKRVTIVAGKEHGLRLIASSQAVRTAILRFLDRR